MHSLDLNTYVYESNWTGPTWKTRKQRNIIIKNKKKIMEEDGKGDEWMCNDQNRNQDVKEHENIDIELIKYLK